jgi:hypothetical protein
MVAALKAPLPDGTQLAAFAAVLGDASEGGAECAGDGGAEGTSAAHTEGGSESPSPSVSEGKHRGGDMEAGSRQHAFHRTA